MSISVDTERQVTLLEEIDARQNELLNQLDELDAQVLALLEECIRHNVEAKDESADPDKVAGPGEEIEPVHGDAEVQDAPNIPVPMMQGQIDAQGDAALPEAA
ncbi:MAG: hypothetical protein ACI9G1_002815 [Pirellulaceae bacterium]|jgi:hypothetical protein